METAEFCISIYSNDNRVNLYYNGTEVTAEAYESIVAASQMSSSPMTITLWHKENDKWENLDQLNLPLEE